MSYENDLAEILGNETTRHELFRRSNLHFGLYYFPEVFKSMTAEFHLDWNIELSDPEVWLLLTAFRESGKDAWVNIDVIRSIVYQFHHFIVYITATGDSSKLFDIIVELQTNQKLIRDFWFLAPLSIIAKKHKTRLKMTEFIFANRVKAKSKGIGQSLRWENYKTPEGLFRPDYVIVNDIDTIENTQTKKVIDKNELRILNEIFGGLAPWAKRVVLGNVIRSDGVIPRLQKLADKSKRWKTFRQKLIVDGKLSWSERYCMTDEEAKQTGKTSVETKMADGAVAFAQNMQLEPYNGESIIGRELIKYWRCKLYDYIWIGIDPAISVNTGTDKMGVVAIGFIEEILEDKSIRLWKYIIESHGWLGKDKEPTKSVWRIKEIYERMKERTRWGVVRCRVENNAFQAMYRKALMAMSIACVPYNSKSDKLTRFLEHEGEFTRGTIFFEPEKNEALIDDVVLFPNCEFKDVVDAMVFGLQGGKGAEVHRISTNTR